MATNDTGRPWRASRRAATPTTVPGPALALLAMLAAGYGGWAHAQQVPGAPRPASPADAPAARSDPSRPGTDAPGANVRSLVVSPGVRASVVASDNIDLRPSDNAKTGGYAEIAPYVQADYAGPRGFGAVRYQLSGRAYTGSEILDHTIRNDLRANGDIAVADDVFRMSATAYVFDIGSTPFNALGTDAVARTTTRTTYKYFDVSPYASGRLSENTDYELRYRFNHVDPGGTLFSSTGNSLLARAGSGVPTSTFGWGARGNVSQYAYDNGFEYNSSLAEVMGYYSPDSRLRFGVGANYTHYSALFDAEGRNSGVGPSASVDWQPNPRTSLFAYWADNYYGTTNSVRGTYRTERWSLGLNWDRGIRDGNQAGLLYYDPSRMFGASSLSGTGTTSSATVLPATGLPLAVNGFQSPLARIDALVGTISYADAVDRVALVAYTREQGSAAAIPGFALVADYRQTGGFVRGSRRMDSLNSFLYGAYYSTNESSNLSVSTKVLSADVGWGVRLSRDLSGQVVFRHTRQRSESGVLSSYDENALIFVADYRF